MRDETRRVGHYKEEVASAKCFVSGDKSSYERLRATDEERETEKKKEAKR